MKLRDRDAIITKEGIIFRVFGYDHPKDVYVCDAEYASERIFTSKDPRSPRTGLSQSFFKFYNDEGLKLVFSQFPQYTFIHKLLNAKLVGVQVSDITKIRKPNQKLRKIIDEPATDELIDATQRVVNKITELSGLCLEEFGVFGSMLHGFHHPKFSDIDLIIYGKTANKKMQRTLKDLYSDFSSDFSNEFENEEAIKGKLWRFKDFSLKEYIWHQKRKQIYGLFKDKKNGRIIKAEFEPVKSWNEITPNYNKSDRICSKGWARIKARVTEDEDAPFIPSIYKIDPITVLKGPECALEVTRIFSYMEEFRLQVKKDEIIIVEGNLEEVSSLKRNFHQITLTYCPRYYEQVLKVNDLVFG